MTTGQILDWFARDHYCLRGLLEECGDVERRAIETLTAKALTTLSDADVARQALARWQSSVGSLELGAPQVGHEPESILRHGPDGADRCWRWRVSYPLLGNPRLARYWPDAFSDEPSGDPRVPGPDPPRFVIQADDAHVVVFCDVKASEDPAGVMAPSARLAAGDTYLRAAVRAVRTDVEAFAEALPSSFVKEARQRRQRLALVSEGLESVITLLHAQPRPIVLDDPGRGEAPDAVEQPLRLTQTLSSESFNDLLEVVRRWRTGIERYPGAVASLKEEDITSILVATLGTVFSTAGRETFQRGGKTDILVSGSVPGCAAHIGEAKVWNGAAKVGGAVDQVLRYATARSKAALLLWYVRHQTLDAIRGNARAAVAELDAVMRVGDDDADDLVADVIHPTFGHHLSLHSMFVHLPKTRSRVKSSAHCPARQAE